MMDYRERELDPRGLSTMLEFREVQRHEWQPQELAAMLRHHFDAPLHLSMGTLSAEVAHQLRQATPPLDPLMTLGQLLHHPQPPVELLRLVKRFAKLCRRDPENPLPSEMVMLLYYASIVVAMTRAHEEITELTPASLRRGLRWLSAQIWIDEEMRSLLQDGLNQVADAAKSQHSAGE